MEVAPLGLPVAVVLLGVVPVGVVLGAAIVEVAVVGVAVVVVAVGVVTADVPPADVVPVGFVRGAEPALWGEFGDALTLAWCFTWGLARVEPLDVDALPDRPFVMVDPVGAPGAAPVPAPR